MIEFEETGPPATDALLDDAERRLGVKLPAALRAFLLRHNGAFVNDTYVLKGVGGVGICGIASVGSTGNVVIDDLLVLREDFQASGSDHDIPLWLVPISADGSGNLVLISTAEDDAGTVYVWDHEEGDATPYRSLGLDFDAFLEALRTLDEVFWEENPD